MGMSGYGTDDGEDRKGAADSWPAVLHALNHRFRPGLHEQAQLRRGFL
jgi:hypothetical protein